MGRGSSISERARKKILEYFKNNVPQRQIVKTLQISSSTAQNIIKRFRETGEISGHKGQVEKCSMVRRVKIWQSCWKSRTPWRETSTKEEGDFPAYYQRSVKKPASLMVWRCISAYGMGSLHDLEGTMNAERYKKVLEQHMLPSRRRVFQQNNAKPHTAAITTAWLCSRRVWVLNWPAWSADISPIENIWCIIKWKTCQRWPRTPETHNLDAQMSSNCFEKKRRCYTMVNMPQSQLFWDM